ncbi:hypothetical protein QLQ12_15425 [Actinoplanes sp. NEAU-A12]|uniref:Uncharacterized protein n=1 Tax=Actinoplanes sandaracinus TaxID=3045177 RepID=A0ABT6WJX6_9ACTN|nr:hypothetical protein [Actinoplanes sandaracinus]MDI6099991.1 hypothetical protein [Actinoplanes sandaracinus]
MKPGPTPSLKPPSPKPVSRPRLPALRDPRTAVRIVGTAGVVVLLSHPVWAPRWGSGLLGEIAGRPLWASAAIVTGFLGLVALYCRALQRTLTLVRPGARRAGPRSVWWMFAIPHNFIEDFFIVRAVAASLTADGAGARTVRRWTVLGYGWCVLQIVSLVPGPAGLAGGAAALPVWAAHWWLTVRVNRALAAGPFPGVRADRREVS